MKETGILFTPDNICAIREGRKTQTRRVMRPQPGSPWTYFYDEGGCLTSDWKLCCNNGIAYWSCTFHADAPGEPLLWKCPYGVPGDRLYIKEGIQRGAKNNPIPSLNHVWRYRLDNTQVLVDSYNETAMRVWVHHAEGDLRTAMFMPKWAARTWLALTEVRVERVQDISEEDAAAEGCESLESEREEYDWKICPRCGGTRLYEYQSMAGARPDTDCTECDTYKKRYRYLWDSINAKKHPWSSNPWVWVLTFKVLPEEGRAGHE